MRLFLEAMPGFSLALDYSRGRKAWLRQAVRQSFNSPALRGVENSFKDPNLQEKEPCISKSDPARAWRAEETSVSSHTFSGCAFDHVAFHLRDRSRDGLVQR